MYFDMLHCCLSPLYTNVKHQQTLFRVDAIFNLKHSVYCSVLRFLLLSNIYNPFFQFLVNWKFAEIHIWHVSLAEHSIHNSTIYWLLSIPQNHIFTCVKWNMLFTLPSITLEYHSALEEQLPIFSLRLTHFAS